MLAIDLDHGSRSVTAIFDLPMPPAILADQAVRSWMTTLEETGDVGWMKDGDGLVGFRAPMESWRRLVASLDHLEEARRHAEILDDAERNRPAALDDGLKVNFHQKPFDTPERYWRFIINQGHFFEYFFNRVNWYLAPRLGIVTSFPLHVDIETASTCNMNCPMCYRRQLKKTGQMDPALFRKAVDECAREGVYSVRLSWRGEALSHPRILDMIAYATARIKNVSFLTNAFYLTDEVVDVLVANKLKYLAVSFDGLDGIYESIRHPAKFQDSYGRLENLRRRRDVSGGTQPQVRVCTIWPAIKDDPEAYQKTMSAVADYCVYNPYINFVGPMRIKPDFICQYPWERIVLAFDGEGQCCTGWNADDIVLGNLASMTIREMWHSRTMARVREIHRNQRRMELSSCRECRHGAEGDPNIDIFQIIQRRH